MLGLSGFEYASVEDIRAEWSEEGRIAAGLNNQVATLAPLSTAVSATLVRVAEVPMYQADPICRRAPSLQQTLWAQSPVASAHSNVLAARSIRSGSSVTVRQGSKEATVRIEADDSLPQGVLRLPTAHTDTVMLAGMFDPIEITQG